MKLLGNIASVLLSAILLLQVGLNSMIFMNFKVNQKSIAEEHCINKDKPEMECDGKCYLKKQLEKTEKDKKPIQSPRYFETEITAISYHSESVDFTLIKEQNKFSGEYFSSISEPHIDVPEVPPKQFS